MILELKPTHLTTVSFVPLGQPVSYPVVGKIKFNDHFDYIYDPTSEKIVEFVPVYVLVSNKPQQNKTYCFYEIKYQVKEVFSLDTKIVVTRRGWDLNTNYTVSTYPYTQIIPDREKNYQLIIEYLNNKMEASKIYKDLSQNTYSLMEI